MKFEEALKKLKEGYSIVRDRCGYKHIISASRDADEWFNAEDWEIHTPPHHENCDLDPITLCAKRKIEAGNYINICKSCAERIIRNSIF